MIVVDSKTSSEAIVLICQKLQSYLNIGWKVNDAQALINGRINKYALGRHDDVMIIEFEFVNCLEDISKNRESFTRTSLSFVVDGEVEKILREKNKTTIKEEAKNLMLVFGILGGALAVGLVIGLIIGSFKMFLRSHL